MKTHNMTTLTWMTCLSSLICLSHVSGDDQTGPVYELRTYTTAAGRLPALHKRFQDHTIRIFEKHGMKNVVYWTPVDQDNTLVYLLEHKSRTAAKASWAAFVKDPEWQKVFKASRQDGPIVTKVKSQFLRKTGYSPK